MWAALDILPYNYINMFFFSSVSCVHVTCMSMLAVMRYDYTVVVYAQRKIAYTRTISVLIMSHMSMNVETFIVFDIWLDRATITT